jgi:hypothetical protein
VTWCRLIAETDRGRLRPFSQDIENPGSVSVRNEPLACSNASCSVSAGTALSRKSRTRSAREGLEPLATALAVIEELAGIGRHRLDNLIAAFGASERGLKLHIGFLLCVTHITGAGSPCDYIDKVAVEDLAFWRGKNVPSALSAKDVWFRDAAERLYTRNTPSRQQLNRSSSPAPHFQPPKPPVSEGSRCPRAISTAAQVRRIRDRPDVQSLLCRLPDYADQCRRTSFRGGNCRYNVGIIRSSWYISDH